MAKRSPTQTRTDFTFSQIYQTWRKIQQSIQTTRRGSIKSAHTLVVPSDTISHGPISNQAGLVGSSPPIAGDLSPVHVLARLRHSHTHRCLASAATVSWIGGDCGTGRPSLGNDHAETVSATVHADFESDGAETVIVTGRGVACHCVRGRLAQPCVSPLPPSSVSSPLSAAPCAFASLPSQDRVEDQRTRHL